MLWLKVFLIFRLLLLISTSQIEQDSGTCYADKCSTPISEFELCQRQFLNRKFSQTLAGLVGMGWDNLQNFPMAQVLNAEYKNCQTTPDGEFLIPDDMQIFPIKKVNLDKTANYYEHWKDYVQSTTETINVEGGFSYGGFGISGSYSTTNQETKERFASEKSSMLHTTLQYQAYSAMVQSQTKLHPAFEHRLMLIHDAIQRNLTRRARYLAELVIRDFGTHVVTKSELGAKIEQEDYVDTNTQFWKDTSFSEMKAAASASFFGTSFFGSGGASYSTNVSEETKEKFHKVLKHSQIRTNGGPSVNQLLSAASKPGDTQLFVNDLVVTDRSGIPLFALINEATLPVLDFVSASHVSSYIKNATEEYYKRNKIEGCMDPSAPNFKFTANVDDKSCNQPYHNHTFGGVYQTCKVICHGFFLSCNKRQFLCDELRQLNGETGNYSCGDLYEPVELITMTYPLPDRADHKCNDCHSIFKPCDSYCYAKLFKYEVRVSSFYCREKPNVAIPEKHGFMFGGLFTKGQINMFTGSASCPGQFQQYRMFHDTIVCLSRNYEVDGPLNIKFSGFFTCQSPPSEAQCPVGYTQHLATVENGCDAFYCVRPEEFNRFIPKRVDRPPFEDPSALTNDTESMLYVYRNNTFWFKQPLEPIIENATNQLTGKGEQNSNGISQDQLNDWIESVYLPSAIQAEKDFMLLQPSSKGSDETKKTDKKPATTGLTFPLNVFIIGGICIVLAVCAALGLVAYKKRQTRIRGDQELDIIAEVHTENASYGALS